MSAGRILLIAAPILFVLAIVLVVASTVSRNRAATGSLGREARRADNSELSEASASAPGTGLETSAAARARAGETRQSLEPAGSGAVQTYAGGLIRFNEGPGDPDQVGVSRRQFFNRGIVAAQSLAWGAFGAAMLGFLWPSLSGGFGGKVDGGSLKEVLASVAAKKQPVYVPEARTYLNPYPAADIPAAKKIYTDAVVAGMELGLVALYQKCVHLGCRVPWCQVSQWFECPCHGSKYNRVGEKKGGPAPRGLDRFAITVNGDELTIDTGTVILGPAIGTNTTGQEAEGPHCV